MKKEINFKNSLFISIEGGKNMEAVLERNKVDRLTKEAKANVCEIFELKKMNEEIVEKNGFCKSDVKRIVNEVCGRNVRSNNRY